MVNKEYDKAPEAVLKILKDPKISHEIKDVCFKFLENPIVEEMARKTPISSLFEICQECIKHPDIYEDIFSGRIKIFFKGLMENALPILNHKTVKEHDNLKTVLGPNTFVGEIVEKFIICDINQNIVKRMTVKVNEDKILTAAFNSQNKMISMLVDPIENEFKKNKFMDFVNSTENKRIDLIRV